MSLSVPVHPYLWRNCVVRNEYEGCDGVQSRPGCLQHLEYSESCSRHSHVVEHIVEGNDIADEDATTGIFSGFSELPAAGNPRVADQFTDAVREGNSNADLLDRLVNSVAARELSVFLARTGEDGPETFGVAIGSGFDEANRLLDPAVGGPTADARFQRSETNRSMQFSVEPSSISAVSMSVVYLQTAVAPAKGNRAIAGARSTGYVTGSCSQTPGWIIIAATTYRLPLIKNRAANSDWGSSGSRNVAGRPTASSTTPTTANSVPIRRQSISRILITHYLYTTNSVIRTLPRTDVTASSDCHPASTSVSTIHSAPVAETTSMIPIMGVRCG